jgi:plastocyanin
MSGVERRKVPTTPIVNPIAAFPTTRTSVTGRAFVNSGIPSDQAKGMTFRVKFPKTGTFKFACLVHPGMFGIVNVVRRSQHIPSRAQDAAAAKREIASIVKEANAKAELPVPAGQVDVGRTGNRLTINAMFPASTTVKAGYAVTFTMAGQSRLEIHTVTLGPESVTAPIENTFITPMPNSTGPPTLVINPLAAFPTPATRRRPFRHTRAPTAATGSSMQAFSTTTLPHRSSPTLQR